MRERLKTATSAIHLELHGMDAFGSIASGECDRRAYGRLLTKLYRFHSASLPLCNRAAEALREAAFANFAMSRLMRLERDLAHLGVGPMPAAGFPEPPDDDFSVGFLYTVQGSASGGKTIHAQLAPMFPTDSGREFFGGSPGDGQVWRLFCARVEDFLKDRGISSAIDGALAGFEHFRACLRAH